ncbi:hypothetical protein PS2_019196 [Malus domestica]
MSLRKYTTFFFFCCPVCALPALTLLDCPDASPFSLSRRLTAAPVSVSKLPRAAVCLSPFPFRVPCCFRVSPTSASCPPLPEQQSSFLFFLCLRQLTLSSIFFTQLLAALSFLRLCELPKGQPLSPAPSLFPLLSPRQPTSTFHTAIFPLLCYPPFSDFSSAYLSSTLPTYHAALSSFHLFFCFLLFHPGSQVLLFLFYFILLFGNLAASFLCALLTIPPETSLS